MIQTTDFTFAGKSYRANLARPLVISIPLTPNYENPNCYYADPPAAEVIRLGSFVGSVAEGGPVNYQKLFVTPHGNGTHTECYGHISPDPEAVLNQCLNRYIFMAQVVSVAPDTVGEDHVVRLSSFQEKVMHPRPEALVLRTLPNDAAKLSRHYSGTNPPYLEAAIGQFLTDEGMEHLLVDLPSVDREVDGGKLVTHRAFWRYPEQIRRHATITELVYVDPTIPDGLYLLQLQVLNLAMDASPSHPVLYPVTSLDG
ncbi:Kynurenine formamidase [Catalinimonas alkaloidigena]|uniref:Kynurenine formamidase n=1 Tax=Catalinimonas alkaloidigena TaxID=1075417 RepID=A0A1G9MMH7_9BACT|nr:cyclase family protein [Catalinimonas alkaloidigena]SDL75460.1 Kynurenine formamidase [Catalinimonas alkaloidigena]